MLLVKENGPNRLDIDLTGPIDADMMRKGLDDLIAKSEGITEGTMLYTIPSFTMPPFGALMIEMGRLPQLFGLLSKFDKCAVLSDVSWIKTAAEIEGALLPGLEIKSFDLDEASVAEAWLASDKPTPAPNTDDDEDNDLGDNMPV